LLQDRLFQISPDPIVEWNAAGRIKRVNAACERIFGRSEEELLAESLVELAHPDDVAALSEAFARLLTTGALSNHEARFLCADGSWRTLVWNCVYDAQDDLVLGMARDVTEQRQLQATDERLRMALEAGEIGTFEWFPDTHNVIVSEQYCRLWGIEPRSVVTTDELVNYLHPEDFKHIGLAKLDSLSTALDYAEYRAIRPDTGELRWLARRGRMVPSADGAPARLVGVLYDVTERQVAERRLTMVLESVTDGFFALDSEWRFTLFNRVAEQFFGKRREDVIGRSIRDLFLEASGSELEANFRRVMQERIPVTFEAPSRARPGRIVEMRIAPKPDGGLAGAFTDITERKTAERHRDLLLHELNHRVKNTLAIVQAMALQTFRGDAADPAALEMFEARLKALAGTHDILTRQNWDSVQFRELVERSLAPFRKHGDDRVTADGPDMQLSARMAVSFAMALHELATNAAKYGALSNGTGNVLVKWRLTRGDGEARVKLLWQERDGPVVVAPSRRGFGSRMIERGLSAELRGDVRLSFEPEGVSCEIDAPLPYSAAENGQTTIG